ncbi:hypothetical protein [Streptomyces rhizosphaericus]|uniref:Uncharacterized protein n=1 Tax=Streptomyces rhizosphaericus TaxID=114699 RepID=A0A6G4AZ46_9ACTN|nr:hypothetical protein [Streptomyces rhizosphaericus]NEW77737.1 hypothetical protein [Streptomyces rhizosphaericus]
MTATSTRGSHALFDLGLLSYSPGVGGPRAHQFVLVEGDAVVEPEVLVLPHLLGAPWQRSGPGGRRRAWSVASTTVPYRCSRVREGETVGVRIGAGEAGGVNDGACAVPGVVGAAARGADSLGRWVDRGGAEHRLDRTLIWNQRLLLHALCQFEIFYNQHSPLNRLVRPAGGLGGTAELRAAPADVDGRHAGCRPARSGAIGDGAGPGAWGQPMAVAKMCVAV